MWSIGSTSWAIYFIRVSWKWVKLKRRKNFDHFSNIEKNIIFYKVSLFYFNYNVCSPFFSLETNRFFFAIKKISFENQFAIINKFTSSELFIQCNDNTWQKLDSFQAKRCFHSSWRRSNWNQNINCRLLIMLTNRACSMLIKLGLEWVAQEMSCDSIFCEILSLSY